MKKCFAMILVVLSVLFLFSCSGDIGATNNENSNENASVRGHITIPVESNLKYSDISFEVAGVDGRHTVKDDGSWEVSGLEEGKSYDIYFTSSKQTRGLIGTEEYGARLKDVIAKYGDSLVDYIADLCLTWSVYGSATLKNVLPSEGLGYTGISVFIPGTSYIARTDKNGNYRITGIPKGTDYTLAYMYDGYTPIESMPFNLDVTTDGKREKEIHTVELSNEKSCVYGTIILEDYPKHSFANGKDNVYARGPEGNSPIFPVDNNGNYSISGLKKGVYSIVYNIFLEDGISLKGEKQVNFNGDDNMRADMLFLGQATSITGKIVCNDVVVSNVTILLNSTNHAYKTVSDDNGVISLDGVFPGEYAITISSDGYMPYTSTLLVKANEPINDLNIELKSITAYGDFVYTPVDGGVSIIDYIGKDLNICIPNTLNGKAVISIGNGAFKGKRDILTIDLPESLKSIGREAFADCTRLESIDIPYTVTYVAASPFSGCLSLKNINVYDSKTDISATWDNDWLYGCAATVNYALPKPRNFTVSRGDYSDQIKLSWDIMKETDHHYNWTIARYTGGSNLVFLLNTQKDGINPESMIENGKMVFIDKSELEPGTDYMYKVYATDLLANGEFVPGTSSENFGYILSPPNHIISSEIIKINDKPYFQCSFDGATWSEEHIEECEYVIYGSRQIDSGWEEIQRIPVTVGPDSFSYAFKESNNYEYFDIRIARGADLSKPYSATQPDGMPIIYNKPNIIGDISASDNILIPGSVANGNGLYPVSITLKEEEKSEFFNLRIWKEKPVDINTLGYEELVISDFTLLEDGSVRLNNVGTTPLGTRYYYSVQSVDCFGLKSPWSNIDDGYSAITDKLLIEVAEPFVITPWKYVNSKIFTSEYPYSDNNINSKWMHSPITNKLNQNNMEKFGDAVELSFFHNGKIQYNAVWQGGSINTYFEYKKFGEIPYLNSDGNYYYLVNIGGHGRCYGFLTIGGMYPARIDLDAINIKNFQLSGNYMVLQENGSIASSQVCMPKL